MRSLICSIIVIGYNQRGSKVIADITVYNKANSLVDITKEIILQWSSATFCTVDRCAEVSTIKPSEFILNVILTPFF